MNTQTFKLDVAKQPQVKPVVYLRQGDKKGTTLNIGIYDGGEAFALAGYSVKLAIRAPRESGYYEVSGSASGNLATFLVDETYAAAVAGVSDTAYVEVLSGSTVIASTGDFRVVVLESAQEGVDPAHAWTNGVEEFLESAQEQLDDAVEDFGEDAQEQIDAAIGGISADLLATAAGNLAGLGESEAAFLHRAVNGGSPVGGTAAETRCLKGNTIVWNQARDKNDGSNYGSNGVTGTKDSTDGSYTVSGTTTASGACVLKAIQAGFLVIGHKYLIKGCCPPGGSSATYYGGIAGNRVDEGNGGIWTNTQNYGATNLRFDFKSGVTIPETKLFPQLFDLTLMFGEGNEPSTVAEFEALYPLAYYPYDAGTLLPVKMQGIGTVGFNLWDEQWELGTINSSGGNSTTTDRIRAKNYVPVIPGTTYFLNGWVYVWTYAADKSYVARIDHGGIGGTSSVDHNTITIPDNVRYLRFTVVPSYGTTYNHDICINVSDPARNGDYEPYWESELAIPVSTYFPTGMKSAGTARDALYADHADMLIGSVDLGTLSWNRTSTETQNKYRFYSSQLNNVIARPSSNNTVGNILCAEYPSIGGNEPYINVTGVAVNATGVVLVYDPDFAESAASEIGAALSGVILYYELATPTVTPISPPIQMTYRVETGGTETVTVDVEQPAPQSAPARMAIVYALDSRGMRDEALSVIAAIENGKASANYAAGSYLIHCGTLYKVTSAIAVGESITPGTNVTATTVMAELIALTS